ncbi:hypothetical protein [Bifidobacterium samirii]|uniref:Uncharacterized protein n=1 Tax=Bifidobacterium samirii TaxID=2306974 RepID=A0A430FJR5_9BIFI|nr:hypothetical protein [Bifidobacterium samirii]RSX53022.1 hypothetical protein D2E24_1693 [Bifidobacterium samirii]
MADIDTDILDQPDAPTDTGDATGDTPPDKAAPGRRTGKAKAKPATASDAAPSTAMLRMESWEQDDADGVRVRIERDMDTGELTVTPVGEA